MDEDNIRVLLIEDNREYAFLIREYIEMVRPGLFEVEVVDRLAPGLERLVGGGLDLVLLDLSLPDSHGLDTFITVHGNAPEIPVIVLTGLDDERTAMEAAREGAQDYLVKGQVTGDLLVRCMLSAIERHQVREKLKHYAWMLEASEARFRGVIESSGDGVAIVDRDGRLRFLNRSAEALLGRDADEIIGQLFGVPAREDQSMEIDVLRPDSERTVALLRAVETRWDGEPASMLTLRDVTQRERLRALERKLEEEGSLIQHLRELDRMKDEFVETVTHELRTPMTPLRSAVEMFLDGTLGELEPAQREMLELMARNIQRLSRFATDVLALSRIDRDEYPVSPREMSVLSTIRPSVELLRERADDKRIELTIDGDPAASALADPDAVCQIVTNLVDNAIAHNPEGTRVHVGVATRDDGDVTLTVSDDGDGIPSEARPHIFDRFTQVKRPSGPGYRGTGIGLAVCKGLLERMGGSVVLESPGSAGTTFRVDLPAPSASSDLLFGRIACALGFASVDEVDDLVHQRGGEGRIGDLLLEQGLIDDAQRDEVLRAQTRRLADPHPRIPDATLRDGLMGQILVDQGYLSATQLHDCLRQQQAIRRGGHSVRLGTLLTEAGYVSRDGVLEALIAQGQHIVACGRCGRRYNVFASEDTLAARCPRCGERLERPSDVAGLEVDGDVLA